MAGDEPALGLLEREVERAELRAAWPGLAPEAVTRSVTLRLAAVSEGARRLAHATAIFGDHARLSDAAALAGLADEDAAPAAGELAAAALLADAVPLAWRHPLLRVAALAGVPAAERTALHLRAARVLGARGADVGLVAAQLLAAEAPGDEWSARVLRRAAADARRRGAPDIAVTLLRHVLAARSADAGLQLRSPDSCQPQRFRRCSAATLQRDRRQRAGGH